jgi:hypothetical protein
MTHIERFWSKVEKTGSCWVWTAGRDWDGYGNFWLHGANTRAHRYSWSLHNGEIPIGLCVLHRCDNPSCVNPSHLFLGTSADNSRDRDLKGRTARHERHGSAKLKPRDIEYIRFFRSLGLEHKTIADMFFVCQATVSHILNGRCWKPMV